MSFIQTINDNIKKFDKLEHENRGILTNLEYMAMKTEESLNKNCAQLYDGARNFLDMLDEMQASLENTKKKIDLLYNKVDSLNEAYDSMYTLKIKKRFQLEYEKKQKDLEKYKQQKNKIVEDLKDNFNKMKI